MAEHEQENRRQSSRSRNFGGLGRTSSRAIVASILGRRVVGISISACLIALVFANLSSFFATGPNALSIGRQMATIAIMAAGLTLVLVAGELDLSVGAIYGLAAMTAGVLMNQGVSVYVSLLGGVGVGAVAGFVNGALSTYGRLPSFIATLGTLSIAQGLTLQISSPQNTINPEFQSPLPEQQLEFFTSLANGKFGPFPKQMIWMAGIMLVLGIAFNRHKFGFWIKATGANERASVIAGIRTKWVKIGVFVVCGACSAIAGILDFSFVGSTDPSAGIPLTFPVFAAVVIGGTSLLGGEGTMLGTFVGALVLAMISNGLDLLGVGPAYNLIFIGGITVIAVAIDRWLPRFGGR